MLKLFLTVLLVCVLCSISGGFNTFREESLVLDDSPQEPPHFPLPSHHFSALLYSLQQDTENVTFQAKQSLSFSKRTGGRTPGNPHTSEGYQQLYGW